MVDIIGTDISIVNILLALLLVILTTVFLLTFRDNSTGLGKHNEPALIITGPSNSGKTALYTLLTTDNIRNTVTSQDINIKKGFQSSTSLIDFPGHVKLRYKLINELKKTEHVKGLVFVVDSTTDPKKLTETAEFLLEIVKITETSSQPIDILIACNKSESFTARPPVKIMEALEKEIGLKIERDIKSLNEVNQKVDLDNGDDGDDSDNESAAFLENFAGSNKFKFSGLEGDVEAVAGSVTKKNISEWQDWIEEKA